MICRWCHMHDIQYPIIIKIYSDYGNCWERDEVYCSWKCVKEVVE